MSPRDDAYDESLPRCPVDGWRRLNGPFYMCETCAHHLVADLAEIVGLAATLDARPPVGAGGRGSPGFRSKVPGRDDVWVARDSRSKPYALGPDDTDTPVRSVAWTLSSWAGLLAEDRGFTHAPPAEVEALAGWLANQVDYIARWPDNGPELARDVRGLRNQLRSLFGDPNPKPAAYCIRLVPTSDGQAAECGAPIFLPRGQDFASVPALWCTNPDRQHKYDGTALLHLKLASDQEQDESA